MQIFYCYFFLFFNINRPTSAIILNDVYELERLPIKGMVKIALKLTNFVRMTESRDKTAERKINYIVLQLITLFLIMNCLLLNFIY